MRLGRLHLATLLACTASGFAACGDDHGPTVCEVGPKILYAAMDRVGDEPSLCTRDEDCTTITYGVRCGGFSAYLCDAIVHRKAAALWDPSAICDQIERASVPSDIGCDISASCGGPNGVPVCRSGMCTGSED
jgi:hypothetical protein